MKRCDAQGHISKGVSFCIVEAHDGIGPGIVGLEEVEDNDKGGESRDEVSKHHRPRLHGNRTNDAATTTPRMMNMTGYCLRER